MDELGYPERLRIKGHELRRLRVALIGNLSSSSKSGFCQSPVEGPTQE